MSTQPPLLLLHGVTMSAAAWDTVVPLLDGRFDLIVPTALGHRGARRTEGRATIEALTDATESLLDERGLTTVHIAGNSLGGWMAIELARRGRATTVCALSPAGLWEPAETPGRSRETLMRTKKLADSTRLLTPSLMRSARFRRNSFRNIALHGDRLTVEQARTSFHDLVGCNAAMDLLTTTEYLHPLVDPTCPITVAWSESDRIFPPDEFVPIARTRLPNAHFVTLRGVGHVPMIDDPASVAQAIVDSIDGHAA
ncbi:alpha/beta fold hydrolase [Rhodococcoides yunnanense]|uniref:alpha/beta fold hydrolase n=1 Tax=Rhodococcoides yunnanense TaxID=278209 RepID=UPI0009321DAA|nr:alpha/beta hydrolase [Rhodococcus yunnanensis]